MISKQDRVRPRTPEDLERKYQNVLNRSTQQQFAPQSAVNESGEPYIKVGDTMVTESQMKQLLELLKK